MVGGEVASVVETVSPLGIGRCDWEQRLGADGGITGYIIGKFALGWDYIGRCGGVLALDVGAIGENMALGGGIGPSSGVNRSPLGVDPMGHIGGGHWPKLVSLANDSSGVGANVIGMGCDVGYIPHHYFGVSRHSSRCLYDYSFDGMVGYCGTDDGQ